jgi:hypothetical protein
MLNPSQISSQIALLQANGISLPDFENWFRRESRNFLAWGDAHLQNAVFAVEGVLSDYHFDGLPEEKVAGELAVAIRPFEQKGADWLVIGSP